MKPPPLTPEEIATVMGDPAQRVHYRGFIEVIESGGLDKADWVEIHMPHPTPGRTMTVKLPVRDLTGIRRGSQIELVLTVRPMPVFN
jgi:hypothetical protein